MISQKKKNLKEKVEKMQQFWLNYGQVYVCDTYHIVCFYSIAVKIENNSDYCSKAKPSKQCL